MYGKIHEIATFWKFCPEGFALNVPCERKIEGKAKTFLDNGGFAERMDRMRRKNWNG